VLRRTLEASEARSRVPIYHKQVEGLCVWENFLSLEQETALLRAIEWDKIEPRGGGGGEGTSTTKWKKGFLGRYAREDWLPEDALPSLADLGIPRFWNTWSGLEVDAEHGYAAKTEPWRVGETFGVLVLGDEWQWTLRRAGSQPVVLWPKRRSLLVFRDEAREKWSRELHDRKQVNMGQGRKRKRPDGFRHVEVMLYHRPL
jgi:hypothetical protein